MGAPPFLSVLTTASLALMASPSVAQESGSMAWFANLWREASVWAPARPLQIAVEYETRSYVDRTELEALRARVGGATTGRDKARLERLEQELANPVVRWTATVCTDGSRTRYGSSDGASKPGLHFALGPSEDWLLQEGSLRIAPPTMAEPEYGVRNYAATADSIVRTVVWAGLGDPEPGRLVPLSVAWTDGAWEGTIGRRGDSTPVSLVRGTVADRQGSGIAGMTIRRRMLADPVVRARTPLGTIEYAETAHSEILGRPVVMLTRWLDGEGRVTQTMRVSRISLVSAEDFDGLMAPPSQGATDPWIGAISLREIQDLRPDRQRQIRVEGGIETVVPLSVPVGHPPKQATVKWFIAPILLATVALVAAWQWRRVGRSPTASVRSSG